MIKVVKTISREVNRETAKFLNKKLFEILTGMLVKSSDTGKLNLSVHRIPVSSKFIESFCRSFVSGTRSFFEGLFERTALRSSLIYLPSLLRRD